MQIDLNLDELKRIIEFQSELDDSFLVKNISSLENATQNDLAVLIDRGDRSVFSPISLEKIKKSNAALILTEKPIVDGKNYLVVKDALKAFQKIVEFVEKKNHEQKIEKQIDSTAIISKSAVIEDGAKIGTNTFIGEQVFIGKGVEIGSNVKIYPGAKILDRCIIGNNCIIHSGTIIGSDGFGYSVTKLGLCKIPQIGIVKIGNDSEIGANCCIDRAAFDQTFIGNGVKLDNQVHIAHNVFIGDHTVILAQTGIAGGAVIGIGCQIGGQVAIRDHIKIGNGVKIVSKSGVMKDLKDGEIVAGIPALPFLQWKRTTVIFTKLPEILKTFVQLKTFIQKFKEKKPWWMRFLGIK